MLLLLWGNIASLLHETAPVVPETVVQSQSGLFKNRISIKNIKKNVFMIIKTIIITRSPAPQAPPRMGAGSPTQTGST